MVFELDVKTGLELDLFQVFAVELFIVDSQVKKIT